MKIVLLFPGQGAQSPGMGSSLYEKCPETREIFAQADQKLNFSLSSVLFSGTEEELKKTEITQPAIFTVSCAAYTALIQRYPELIKHIAFCAGHSLGEYSAFFAAGAFDFPTGIALVQQRGLAIQQSCEKTPGTMLAVLGIERQTLQTICSELSVGDDFCEMVNFNSPGQIVVAGTVSGIRKCSEKISQIPGSKVIPLTVSGAFHSRLMKQAALSMKSHIDQAPIHKTRIPVYTNVDAEPTVQPDDIRQKLFQQIDHPVLWEDTLQKMIANNIDCFIELGPGRVLSGLVKKIDRKKKTLNIEDEESLNKTLDELKAIAV